MPAGVVATESKVKLLTQHLATALFASPNLKMGLSNANISPSQADTLSTYAAGELTAAGYARQTVTGWGTPVITADFHALAAATAVTFQNTGLSASPTIYTWFLVDTAANKLVMAGAFDLPFSLPALLGSYTTTPFWKLTGE